MNCIVGGKDFNEQMQLFSEIFFRIYFQVSEITVLLKGKDWFDHGRRKEKRLQDERKDRKKQ